MKKNYRESVLLIATQKTGLRKDLIAQIGLEDYRHFCSISVIKEIFIDGRPAWQSTSEADRLKDFYREPTEEEKKKECFCASA